MLPVLAASGQKTAIFSYVYLSLDYFFVVGNRWFSSLLFVVAFSAFAEFTAHDSLVLSWISDRTQSLPDELARQSSALVGIESDVDIITGAVWDIYDELHDPLTTESIYSRLDRFASNFTFDVNGQLKVYDPSNNYYQIQILDRLDQLISNSLYSASGVIYTNLAVLQDWFYPSVSSIDQLQYYRWLTGNPDASEYEAGLFFANLNSSSSVSPFWWHFFDPLSKINYSILDSDQQDPYYFIYDLLPFNDFVDPYLNSYSSLYYDQYATKPIFDFLESLTNGVPDAAQFYSSDHYGNPALSPSGSIFFSGLGSAFTGTVSTNIASINTNAIEEVENDSITGIWQDATGSDPSSGNLGTVVDTINNLSSGVSSTIRQAFSVDTPDSFSLDFNVPFSVSSSDTRLYSYELTSPLLKLRPYVSFFASLAKLLLALYFAGLIWVRVVKPLIGFHNAEDPF